MSSSSSSSTSQGQVLLPCGTGDTMGECQPGHAQQGGQLPTPETLHAHQTITATHRWKGRTCVPNSPLMCGSSNCRSQEQPPLQVTLPVPTP